MTKRPFLAFVFPWFLAACDQAAGAQASHHIPAPPRERPDVPVIEGETCTRTEDCPRSGRCIDGHCLPQTRSFQAELLAERGARALATANYQDAVDAFHSAQQAYHDHQLAVPSSVACGLARALTAVADRGAAPNAREGVARAYADCLATAAPNSATADQALSGLVSLSDRGLEVAALDRPDAALMTGTDPRPTPENTLVRVSFSAAASTDDAKAPFAAMVAADPLRLEVVRCFLQWWPTAHQNHDEGTLRVAYQRGVDDYDELTAPHLTVTAADLAPSSGDAGANVHWLQCAANAVTAASATLRWPGHQGHWAETISLAVGTH